MCILRDIWCRHSEERLFVNKVSEYEFPRIGTRAEWLEHLTPELMVAYGEYLETGGIDPRDSVFAPWANHALDGMLLPANAWHERNVRHLSDDY